jgi:hypothetical protein
MPLFPPKLQTLFPLMLFWEKKKKVVYVYVNVVARRDTSSCCVFPVPQQREHLGALLGQEVRVVARYSLSALLAVIPVTHAEASHTRQGATAFPTAGRGR